MAEKTTMLYFNGTAYPLVPISDFSLDENLVLWHWAQMGPDEIPHLKGVHVGVIAALIEVAVARAEPRVQTRELRRMIGAMKQAELEEALADVVDEEEPETPLDVESESASDESTSSSGGTSSPTGESRLAVVEANGSGSGGSDESSTSDLATSAG
jgi:hypothetical protein